MSADTYLEEELSHIGSMPQRAPSINESKSLGCKLSTQDLVNEGVKGIFVCVLLSFLIQKGICSSFLQEKSPQT